MIFHLRDRLDDEEGVWGEISYYPAGSSAAYRLNRYPQENYLAVRPMIHVFDQFVETQEIVVSCPFLQQVPPNRYPTYNVPLWWPTRQTRSSPWTTLRQIDLEASLDMLDRLGVLYLPAPRRDPHLPRWMDIPLIDRRYMTIPGLVARFLGYDENYTFQVCSSFQRPVTSPSRTQPLIILWTSGAMGQALHTFRGCISHCPPDSSYGPLPRRTRMP